jgi:hypothetical protein
MRGPTQLTQAGVMKMEQGEWILPGDGSRFQRSMILATRRGSDGDMLHTDCIGFRRKLRHVGSQDDA